MKKGIQRKKLFIRYLKETGLYENYVACIRDYQNKPKEGYYTKSFYDVKLANLASSNITDYDMNYSIMSMFPWVNTPQGDNYWMELYRKWLLDYSALKKINKKIYKIYRKRKINEFKVIR